jgi:hypothetical protein
MKKRILLLCLLVVIVISGCATGHGGHGDSGGNEKTSEHQGGCGH